MNEWMNTIYNWFVLNLEKKACQLPMTSLKQIGCHGHATAESKGSLKLCGSISPISLAQPKVQHFKQSYENVTSLHCTSWHSAFILLSLYSSLPPTASVPCSAITALPCLPRSTAAACQCHVLSAINLCLPCILPYSDSRGRDLWCCSRHSYSYTERWQCTSYRRWLE